MVSKDEQYWADNFYVGLTHGGMESAFGVNHGTGHIKSYPAEAPGPMGNYVRAVRGDAYGENSFVDNSDGTVTDTATWLMWQQDDSGAGMDWETSLAWAEDLELGGYSDWRLPNIKELYSIVDYTHSPNAVNPDNPGPAIDMAFFNITEMPEDSSAYNPDYGYYWTSTSAYFNEQETTHAFAWYVAFGTAVDSHGEDLYGAGGIRYDHKSENCPPLPEVAERIYNYVRCVRDTGTGIEETENGEQTVSLYTSAGNPFTGTAVLQYETVSSGKVSITVFDMSGRTVGSLLDFVVLAGSGSVSWDASDSPPGQYLCVMNAAGLQKSVRLVVLQ